MDNRQLVCPSQSQEEVKEGCYSNSLLGIGLGNDSSLNLHIQMHTVALHYIGYLHAGKLQ